MSFNSLKNSNDNVIKALKETEKLANLLKAKKDKEKYTVWVGGIEVTNNYVNRKIADSILTDYLHKGYDQNDVWIEEEVLDCQCSLDGTSICKGNC